MKNIKQINRVIILAIITIFVLSCATNSIVWDDKIPENEITTIYWIFYGGDVVPVSYNGIPIDWKFKRAWNELKLPAGVINFEISGKAQGPGTETLYTYENIPFSYNFEKGKEYTVYASGGIMKIHAGKSYKHDTFIESIDFRRKGPLVLE